jgi:hypothetical protein
LYVSAFGHADVPQKQKASFEGLLFLSGNAQAIVNLELTETPVVKRPFKNGSDMQPNFTQSISLRLTLSSQDKIRRLDIQLDQKLSLPAFTRL